MAAPTKQMLSWGANSYGQLGQGHQEDLLLPKVISKELPFIPQTISGGGGHTILLTDTGQCYSYGLNAKGQLGQVQSQQHTSQGQEYTGQGQGHQQTGQSIVICPQIIQGPLALTTVVKVAAGWDFTLFVTSDGKLYSCGSNAFGQLGIPECTSQDIPIQVGSTFNGSKVCSVACGMRHSLVLTDSGSVYTCGIGKKGQLGTLQADGKPDAKTQQFKEVMLPGGSTKVCHIAAGAQHSAAVTEHGQVIVWGDNRHGQLARDPSESPSIPQPTLLPQDLFNNRPVRQLQSGWAHMLAVTEDGVVYSWGRGDYGQLGRDRQGSNLTFDPVPHPVNVRSPVAIACGSEHNLVLTGDGKVHSWGWNEHGMCATGDEANVPEPRLVEALKDSRVVSIGCGAGHSVVLVEGCR